MGVGVVRTGKISNCKLELKLRWLDEWILHDDDW